MRKQFLLISCEALTIHKSQGQAYRSVIVHLKRQMTHCLLYIVCSYGLFERGVLLVGNFQVLTRAAEDPLMVQDKNKANYSFVLQK
jgi:hypothetical protein